MDDKQWATLKVIKINNIHNKKCNKKAIVVCVGEIVANVVGKKWILQLNQGFWSACQTWKAKDDDDFNGINNNTNRTFI